MKICHTLNVVFLEMFMTLSDMFTVPPVCALSIARDV